MSHNISGLLKYQSVTHSSLRFFSSSTKKTWHVSRDSHRLVRAELLESALFSCSQKRKQNKTAELLLTLCTSEPRGCRRERLSNNFLTQTRLCFVQTVPCAPLPRTHAAVCCCAWTSAVSSTNLSVKLTCADQTSALLKTLHETCKSDGRYETYLLALS